MGITASWAGGQRGRTVLDRVLPVVKRLLSSKGLFYLVTLKANDPSEICEVMKKKGFSSCILIQVGHELTLVLHDPITVLTATVFSHLHLFLWHAT